MSRHSSSALPRVTAHPLRALFQALSLGAALSAPYLAVAQSAYTVTTLSNLSGPGPSTVPNGNYYDGLIEIDASNRVYAHRPQFNFFGALIGAYVGANTSYQPRPATWAASTAASVSPSNLAGTNVSMELVDVSENGQWQIIFSSGTSYQAVNAGRATVMAPPASGTQYWVDINNNGVAGGNVRDASTGNWVPVSWQAGVRTVLPLDGFSKGEVRRVTNDNVIWGTVSKPTGGAVLARWANGQLVTQEAPTLAGRALSGVVTVNEAGQMVLWYASPIDPLAPNLYALWRNGQFTPLPENLISVIDFNNNGVILGYQSITASQGAYVIFKDGKATELRALITSKGGKLPAGAEVSGRAINDQGSIVGRYFAPNSATAWFRATAKP